jgi:hypothetical protein
VTTLYLILMLLACVLFALAALNIPSARLNLMALGLLAWALVPTLHLIDRL